MTLRRNEKILLFILAVVVVLFGGFKWLILPAYEKTSADRGTYLSLLAQQSQAKAEIKAASYGSGNVQSSLSRADEAAKPLLPSVDTDVINVWLANLAHAQNLTIADIRFTSPQAADIGKTNSGSSSAGTPAASGGEVRYRLGDALARYQGTSPASSSSSASASSSSAPSGSSASAVSGEGAVLAVQVTLTLKGTPAETNALLDAVKSSGKTVAVTGLDYAMQNNVFTAVIELTCYGTEKPDGSDTTFAWSLPDPSGKNGIM